MALRGYSCRNSARSGSRQPKDPKWTPYAPLNTFWNAQELANAAYRDGGSPSNDTMYSIAWLDLSKEPLILSVPDVGLENDESRHGPRIPQTKGHLANVKNFASIGIGPGQDVEKMDASTKRGLERAAAEGMKVLRGAITTGLGKKVNGWTYPPPARGRAGLHDDFLLRGSLHASAESSPMTPRKQYT